MDNDIPDFNRPYRGLQIQKHQFIWTAVVALLVASHLYGNVEGSLIRFDLAVKGEGLSLRSFARYMGLTAYLRAIKPIGLSAHRQLTIYHFPPSKNWKRGRSLLFTWSSPLPQGFAFPQDTGYLIQTGSIFEILAHFPSRGKWPESGIRLYLSLEKPLFEAKIGSLGVHPPQFPNPPRISASEVKASCQLAYGPVVLHAVMTDTNPMGTHVVLTSRDAKTTLNKTIVQGSPQSMQTFQTIMPSTINANDLLTVSCFYHRSALSSSKALLDQACVVFFIYVGMPYECRWMQSTRGEPAPIIGGF